MTVKPKKVSVRLVNILSKGRKSKMINLAPRVVLTRMRQENKKRQDKIRTQISQPRRSARVGCKSQKYAGSDWIT